MTSLPTSPTEIPVKTLLTSFRVRRAARQPGQADTLHALEWLGGEAFVAPLPMPGRAELPRRDAPVRAPANACDADWRAI